ncbi:winged helix-turn-helix transcriptional regulator [Cohnella sp. JJ-181]|uniref:winged helix-turn-helix transcriptional regulator n=1 Tax=Cohnella rhizoplanae TaxID=2974897 RepID=UPI0022FF9FEF|nr:helix-turn-helix domain-containing protein [Cohnella sp. JJ-181]CAI6061837.1 putative HTH-type transcriptional regulator YtcD [Cohnella sp. JJ-181]
MEAREPSVSEGQCPIETVIHVVGGKWKPTILWHLLESTMRFSALEKKIPEVTQKMLAQHLRELENQGVVTRTIHPTVPPKVEYSLSEYGRTLAPVLQSMCDWGRIHNRLGGDVPAQQIQG